MAKVVIKALIEGGKATPAPPLGPALAPHKVNVGQVIAKINEKTKEFAGMQVPVDVIINTDDKSFDIKVGTPPISAMIKKELKLEKLAKSAWKEESVGNLTAEQAIKIARAKMDKMGTKDIKRAVKQVVGSCVSSGVTVEGKNPKDAQKDIDAGAWDSKFK
jgi:large subunit ribosomal protein L11